MINLREFLISPLEYLPPEKTFDGLAASGRELDLVNVDVSRGRR